MRLTTRRPVSRLDQRRLVLLPDLFDRPKQDGSRLPVTAARMAVPTL